jgi:hypothetical protein
MRMPKPSPLLLATFALAAVCAFFFGWLWFQPSEHRARRAPAREDPGTAAVSASALTAEGDAALPPAFTLHPLLAALQRMLAQHEARAREAVLTFKDDESLRRFLARASRAGLTIRGTAGPLRSVRVGYNSLRALNDELLANGEDYAALSGNALVSVPQIPARQERADIDQVPFRNDTLAYLGATGDRSSWGRGVTVAILDTGVAPDATFGTGRLRTLDIGLGTSPGTSRDDGHGTSVAALAAGMSPDAAGVAPAANVLSIRVTDASGTSDLFTVSQAIVTAVDAGAKVINVSLGGYATGAVLDAAIGYAREKGAVIVAAAGNDQAAQLAWPAADARVISVGAVDRADQQVQFSNSGASLQLTAPGYGVQTAWLDNQRAYVDGTSVSAPLVAGAIAAVLSQNPQLSAQQAADLVLATASDGGQPGTDAAYGRGILNVGWAMNRNNPNYIDTAVASHHFDTERNEMQFVVQNRSGRSVSGMTLNVAVNNIGTTHSVPSLAPGESFVARVPVTSMTLNSSAGATFLTQLTNPVGANDQIPANNRKASVLAPPQ